MKKTYLKPNMVMVEKELTQMLCSSTVINPGENNKPAGARNSGGNGNSWDEAMSRRGNGWNEYEE